MGVDANGAGWAPRRFQCQPITRRVEILVVRDAIDDLRNLVVFVIIVKGRSVEREAAAVETVLGPDFKGVHILGPEGSIDRLLLTDRRIDVDTRWICSTSLVDGGARGVATRSAGERPTGLPS